MTPKNHIVHYKGYTIHYENGVYKIAELPIFPFLSMTEAMKHVTKEVNKREFFNINPPNDKTNKAEII